MKELIHAVRGTTRLLGIIGHPLTYTLSPAMQNAALHARGVDAIYLPFPIAPVALADGLRGLKALANLDGFNVTIPHKESVLPFLDAVDPSAERVGAVNTVVVRGGKWTGHNTDVHGFVAGLGDAARFAGKPAVIVGAGGAAKAVAAALAEIGVARLTLADIDPARAAALAARLAERFPALAVATVVPAALEAAVRAAALVVNASPLGMDDNDRLPLDPAWLGRGQFYYDLVYHLAPTAMMAAAAARGCATVGGLGMLLHQGARAFELWTGHPAPVKEMGAALEAALQRPPA